MCTDLTIAWEPCMHVGMIVVTGIVRVAMSKDGAGEEVLGEVEVVEGGACRECGGGEDGVEVVFGEVGGGKGRAA